MSSQPFDVVRVLRRIKSEYLEMPGLKLTRAQAQRLWGLDAVDCDDVLRRLEDEHFLAKTSRDAYVRADLVY